MSKRHILTKPQWAELQACVRAAQSTYGSARTRVQRTLSEMKLVEFVVEDGIDVCRATEEGRQMIAAGWRKTT